jgi:hypothetical protein
MFAAFANTVRADARRQIDWIRTEVERQTRYSSATVALAAAGALAAIGVIVVALVALHLWVAMRYGPFAGLGVVAAVLALAAAFALSLAYARKRPAIRPAPALQSVASLKSVSAQSVLNKLKPGFLDFKLDPTPETAERVVKAASDTIQNGSRSAVYGTLAVAMVMGLVLGRRL